MAHAIEKTSINFTPVNVEARKKLNLRPGQTVRVHQRIQEKGKTRIQVFEGLVLSVKHGKEPGATFTVRKVSSNVGVERVFPLYSPVIEKIEIVRDARVRRAKLYYVRDKVARAVRSKIKQTVYDKPESTADYEAELAAQEPAEEEESTEESQGEAQAEENSEEVVSEEASFDKTQDKQEEASEEVQKEEEAESPESSEETNKEEEQTEESSDEETPEEGEEKKVS